MGYGTRLKTLLKDRKLSIKELSDNTGISLNTLYSITKRDNEKVDVTLLAKIAKFLNINLSELMDSEEDLPTVEEILKIREANMKQNKVDYFISWARIMGITIHQVYLNEKDINGFMISNRSNHTYFVDDELFDKILALNSENLINLAVSLGTDVTSGTHNL